MKLVNNILLIAILAVAPVMVVYAQQHDDMGMSAMSEDQRSKMQEHMKEMDTLLQQLKEEKDPAKREAMLDSHVKGMEKMMPLMDGKAHGMGSGEKHKIMMNKAHMDANSRIDMMEERMIMMEGMMGQMIGHTVEKAKTNHKHMK